MNKWAGWNQMCIDKTLEHGTSVFSIKNASLINGALKATGYLVYRYITMG